MVDKRTCFPDFAYLDVCRAVFLVSQNVFYYQQLLSYFICECTYVMVVYILLEVIVKKVES